MENTTMSDVWYFMNCIISTDIFCFDIKKNHAPQRCYTEL